MEGSEKGIEDDLHKIIGVCDACFKDQPNANPSEIEEVFNGIVSMLALVRLTTHSFIEYVRTHNRQYSAVGVRYSMLKLL